MSIRASAKSLAGNKLQLKVTVAVFQAGIQALEAFSSLPLNPGFSILYDNMLVRAKENQPGSAGAVGLLSWSFRGFYFTRTAPI
jgi:hypothetical protein